MLIGAEVALLAATLLIVPTKARLANHPKPARSKHSRGAKQRIGPVGDALTSA